MRPPNVTDITATDDAPLPRAEGRRRAPSLRASSSVMVPFWVSLAAFLLLALVAASLLGRTSVSAIPSTVFAYQRALATEMAQNVRRGLNEGVADVAHAASNIDAGDVPEASIEDLRDVHDRYDEVAVRTTDGPTVPGIAPITRDGDDAVIEMSATVTSGGAVVARYDPAFLRFALASAEPGVAFLVDEEARILSASAGYLPYAPLPSAALRTAAREAIAGRTGASSPAAGTTGSVVAWAPVTGEGPGGQLRLAVVSEREIGSLSLPATDVRREGLVVAVLVAMLSVAVFSWVWLVVLMPLQRLQAETDRVVRGDFSTPVAIIRYDEIGLVSRAVDRLRVLLIGSRVPAATKPEAALGRGAPQLRTAVVALVAVVGLALFVALLAFITTIGADAESEQLRASDGRPRAASSTTVTTSSAPATTAPPEPSIVPVSCEARPGVVAYRAEVTLVPASEGEVEVEVAIVDDGVERGRAAATVAVPAAAAGVLAVDVPVEGTPGGSCEVRAVRVVSGAGS